MAYHDDEYPPAYRGGDHRPDDCPGPCCQHLDEGPSEAQEDHHDD